MDPNPREKPGALVYHLKDVTKIREKGGNLFELHVPSLETGAGEFIAVVGESGCGKSTLLDILGLVLKPTKSAEFRFFDSKRQQTLDIMNSQEFQLADMRKTSIGYVLQTGGLFPFLSVRENIYLPCRINAQTGFEADLQQIVSHLRIEGQLDKKPQYLSGGQRQRAAIARALAHKPSVVLADEPTAAVDKITANDILQQFKTLTNDLGVTLLMVTHDLRLVEDVVDRMFTFRIEPVKNQHNRSYCYEMD